MIDYSEARLEAKIAAEMSKAGLESNSIINEMPAIKRVYSDQCGMEPERYTKNKLPAANTYLGGFATTKSPSTANALLDNLSQRVNNALVPARYMLPDAMTTTAAIAHGAQSIEKVKEFYEALGLLKKFYTGDDVVEDRYAASAYLYAKYLEEQNKGDMMGESDMEEGGSPQQIQIGDTDGSLTDEQVKFINGFAEWIETIQPYMQIISKYIDKTIGAPTIRVKHERTDDDDGEELDITELDFSQFNDITFDSLISFGINKYYTALMLDELTMEQRYTLLTKKWIDVFVVDNSSSMAGERVFKSAAYLWNRLEKVVRGWAMLAIVEFDTTAKEYILPEEIANGEPRWLINTPEKAKWAMKSIIYHYANFVGGGTDIPIGVRHGVDLAKRMEKYYNGHSPNITVITDDDSSITAMSPSSIDMEVNGLAVASNTGLQDFCIKTGGSYYNLDAISLNTDMIQYNLGEG